MSKAAFYVRVSTDKQEAEGHSLDNQIMKIKAYCELHGINFNQDDVYSDTSSGSNMNRPGLQSLLNNKDQYTDLVVMKLDRLTRKGRDFYTLKDQLFDEAGIHFHSVLDHISTDTAIGRAMLNMLLTYSQFEVDTLRERTRSALEAKKAKGEPMGRAPYGYEYDGKELIKNKDEQSNIKRMQRLRRAGLSISEIREKLYEEKRYTRAGQFFSTATIHKITKKTKVSKSRIK
jgi:site-specific DNA recombinase